MKRRPVIIDGALLLAAAVLVDVSCSTDLAADQDEVWSCSEFSGEYEFSLALDGSYLFEAVGRRWSRYTVLRDDQQLVVAYDVWGSPDGEEGRNVGSIVLLSKRRGDFMRYRLDLTSVYLVVRGACESNSGKPGHAPRH